MDWWEQICADGCPGCDYLFAARRRFMHVLFPALNQGPLKGIHCMDAVKKLDSQEFQRQVFQMDLLGSTYN